MRDIPLDQGILVALSLSICGGLETQTRSSCRGVYDLSGILGTTVIGRTLSYEGGICEL